MLFKKGIFLFIIFIALSVFYSKAQQKSPCTTIGQNSGSAFPVCGSNIFSQSSVPQCGGDTLPVLPCGNYATYTDKNPFWYKFTCFKTGTLGFLIVPNNILDDYDWQLFDITNHDAMDVYTDSSLIVAGNWSGQPGITGANDTGTNVIECGTDFFHNPPNISAMPTLIKEHQYLMLVSHFSDNQFGYNLSFGGSTGGTAIISDTLTPNISNVKVSCDGMKVKIKLNKSMLCSSIASDGSDFLISTNPLIDSIKGRGCRTGFDMDSVTIYLKSPLPTGTYQLTTQTGSDGATFKDICGTGIPINETFSFTKKTELPIPLDSITTPLPCMPQRLQLVFKRPIRCNSVAPDGSDFIISGPSPVSISNATTDCDSNGLSSVINVNLSTPISISGNYKIKLVQPVNFSPIIDECSIPTPVGSLNFMVVAKDSLNARFTSETTISCKQETVFSSFFGMGTGNNNANSWQWFFDSVLVATTPKDTISYTDFSSAKVLSLVVSNGVCFDTSTINIHPTNHFIKAAFQFPDTACPTIPVLFSDSSKGNIVSWKWSFGNRNIYQRQSPPLQSYPISFSDQTYAIKLVVTNSSNCIDSIQSIIVIKSSRPPYADSITKVGCSDSIINLIFVDSVLCNSIAPDGSNFSVKGPDSLKVLAATPLCNGVTATTIQISLSKPVKLNGVYSVLLHASANGDSIVNSCNIRTPDTLLHFTASHLVLAIIQDSIHIGCKQDTIFVTNTDKNLLDNCKWTLNNTQTLLTKSGRFIDSIFNPMPLQLILKNDYCSDTSIVTLIPASHLVKSDFTTLDTICPNIPAVFTNASQGNLSWFKWTFGNNDSSNLVSPPNVSYPFLDSMKTYQTRLIVKNTIGCYDTSVYKPVTVRSGSPAKIDHVLPLQCSPTLISLSFNKPLLCSSLNKNGTDFSITGPSNVLIDSAKMNCNDGLFYQTTLYLHDPILVSGNYIVKNTVASDGTFLHDGCNIPTQTGNSISVKALNAAKANFDAKINYGCKEASVEYVHNGANGVIKWQWFINDSLNSIARDTVIKYVDLTPKQVYLIVSNEDCSDTSKPQTISFDNETDTVKAHFSIQKMDDGSIEYTNFICPTETAIFKDSSIGMIKYYFWDFKNGNTSNAENPQLQTYPRKDSTLIYPVMHVVVGNYCKDTAYNNLKVIPNCYIAVPSAFTPNERMTNKNNRLYPLNAYKADNLIFKVFNRFGQLLYQTTDWTSGGWDGTVNGVSQDVGTYVWTLYYIDHDTREPVSLKGTAVLLK